MGVADTVQTRRQAMALAAALFAGGALLTLVALAAPRSAEVDVAGSWAVALGSAVIAAVYWLGRDSLPFQSLYVGIALGTAMITFGIYINGERDGGAAALNEVYYVWPVVFAAYYFPWRVLVAELVLVAAAYAAALRLVDAGSIAPTRWLIVVTMLAGVGWLIRRLQTRLHDLLDQLAETARRDVLTGLLNRRGFEERLEAELTRATRGERPVALVLGDVDRFKEVNDRLGHPAGDAVLLRVAELLAGVGRRGDTVARLGGEEFVFVLPDAEIEQALALAERARRAVETAFADEPLPLTASFGAVAFPRDGTTPSALLETADRALYAAKDGGRNRSVAALART
ncbi:MAG: GGDEF domain-containing protein [Solirubrobacterales bacterium]|nr:GGDEF domain-containing protein [Solirubrobacterales bacterium]